MSYNYKPKTCEICGEMYVPRSSQQLYCDPCRRRKHIEATHAWHASEHGREMTRLYKIAKRGEEHELVEVKVKGIVYLRPMVPCPDCGKMFLRIGNSMKRCEACAKTIRKRRADAAAARKRMELFPERKAQLEAQIAQTEADVTAGLANRRRLISLCNTLEILTEKHLCDIGDEEGLARIKAERDARKAEQEARAKERAIIVAGNALLRKAEAEARTAERAAGREAKKKARAEALAAKREARRQETEALKAKVKEQAKARRQAEREAREAARAAKAEAAELAKAAARAKREEAKRRLAEAISAEKKAMASMPPCEPLPIIGRKRLACDPKELRTVETTLEMRYCARLHMSSSNLPCGKDQVLCGGCEFNVKPMLHRVEKIRSWGWEG